MSEPEIRVCIDDADVHAAMRLDARFGLRSNPKYLPLRLHYDSRGAALFGELTRQPEYYPTQCEREILERRAPAIAEVLATERRQTGGMESPMAAPVAVIELGAGRAEKIRVVLDALAHDGQLEAFWPFDVDAGSVREVVLDLATRYPDIRVGGIVGDFGLHLAQLPDDHHARLVAFLGGTFGNMTGLERGRFLQELWEALRPGDWFMVGADLVKDPRVLLAAYDDAAGITAAFNLNVLNVLNEHLDADFEPDRFEHVVLWDERTTTVQLRLRASRRMKVDLAGVGLDLSIAAGEQIHTGISTKFHPRDLEQQLRVAGFEPHHYWTDSRDYFGVFLAQVV